MSIPSEIRDAFPDHDVRVSTVDTHLHGEEAVRVTAFVESNKVVGVFTKNTKESFGGVAFESRKDIPGLMVHKINQVLRGTSE